MGPTKPGTVPCHQKTEIWEENRSKNLKLRSNECKEKHQKISHGRNTEGFHTHLYIRI